MKRVGEEAASGLVSGAISVASGAGSDEAKGSCDAYYFIGESGESPLESPKNVVDSKKSEINETTSLQDETSRAEVAMRGV